MLNSNQHNRIVRIANVVSLASLSYLGLVSVEMFFRDIFARNHQCEFYLSMKTRRRDEEK